MPDDDPKKDAADKPEQKPEGQGDEKDQDFLDDWKRLNKNPPSVKDGPEPKPTDSDSDEKS